MKDRNALPDGRQYLLSGYPANKLFSATGLIPPNKFMFCSAISRASSTSIPSEQAKIQKNL
jgi:hypothetical protein